METPIDVIGPDNPTCEVQLSKVSWSIREVDQKDFFNDSDMIVM